jgi:hypothetical protein
MSETFKFFNENFRDTNAVVSHTRLRNKALEAAEGRKVTVARDSTGICVTVDPAATAECTCQTVPVTSTIRVKFPVVVCRDLKAGILVSLQQSR